MSERSELDKAVKFWGAEDYCNGIKALVTAGKEKLATMEPDEYLPQKGAIVEMYKTTSRAGNYEYDQWAGNFG